MAIRTDPVFLGATRPSIIARLNITMGALGLILIITPLPFVFTGNELHLLVCIPLYGICRAIEENDPCAFRMLRLWVITKCACPTYFFWRAATVDPLPKRRY